MAGEGIVSAHISGGEWCAYSGKAEDFASSKTGNKQYCGTVTIKTIKLFKWKHLSNALCYSFFKVATFCLDYSYTNFSHK